LLDLYEAGSPLAAPAPAHSRNPKLAAESAALTARLTLLKKIHPRLADQLAKRLKQIPSEVALKKGIRLVKVDDSFHAFEPKEKECAVEQLAIRKAVIADPGERFVIDGELWDALSVRSRAALLSHEMIYEYFFKLGETDSRKARIFNALLWGDGFAKLSKSTYWQKVRDLKIAMYD
jgi:hypothetical protein